MFNALVLNKEEDQKATNEIKELDISMLPEGDVLVNVDYSTINYKDSLANTKRLVSKLQNIHTVNKIRKTLSKRYESRKGGYTRIIKAGYRYGDNAPMAIIELISASLPDQTVKSSSVELIILAI